MCDVLHLQRQNWSIYGCAHGRSNRSSSPIGTVSAKHLRMTGSSAARVDITMLTHQPLSPEADLTVTEADPKDNQRCISLWLGDIPADHCGYSQLQEERVTNLLILVILDSQHHLWIVVELLEAHRVDMWPIYCIWWWEHMCLLRMEVSWNP